MSNPTIHINPKFRTVHINPNFLPKNVQLPSQQPSQPKASAVPTNIFVNPNFLHPSVHHSLPHVVNPSAFTSAQPPYQPIAVAPAPKYAQSKIISQTNRKLVRQPIVSQEPPKLTTTTATTSSPLLRIGMRKLVRRGSTTTGTKTAAIRSPVVPKTKPIMPHASSKYRVRNIANSTVSPINRYKFDRRLMAGTHRASPYSSLKHQLLSIGQTKLRYPRESQTTNSAHRKLAYLNINGVFYKSTKNKLQRHDQTKSPAIATATRSTGTTAVSNQQYGGGVRSIIVRGVKYSMSADSKRLQRDRSHITGPSGLASPATNNGARLDIGGMTYVQVTPDTFERTDGHRTRGYLTAARQKSIHLLLAAGNRTKSNVPCVIFQRLGKCRALERGRCPRVHDAKRVAICPKFLLGSCQLNPCLLSHAVTLSKMPTCKFFLAGICVRDDCPYLHKKLNAKATICPDFLRGFCERAEECDKRHEFLCPDHTATGSCDKPRCPYPHPSAEKRAKKSSKPEESVELDTGTAGASDVEYIGRSLQGVLDKVRKVKARYTTSQVGTGPALPVSNAKCNEQPSGDQDRSQLNTSDDVLVLIPSRPKLGALPSYIPF